MHPVFPRAFWMLLRSRAWALPGLAGLCLLLTSAAARSAPPVDFNWQVKPILSTNCFHCHGPDAKERKGGTDGLRLDTAAGAMVDLGGYAALVPGKPDASALVERITSEEPEERMPPASSGKHLTRAEIEVLKQWVREGAHYAPHWSYVKPARHEPPQVRRASWPRNPIDRFVLARLEREGLRPSPEAERAALIRRVSLDLTGLPPSLDEVDEFVLDNDAAAYEKLVDRLLAKPAYGEHWARLWLDLARYADSAGYADDPSRRIWLYRDYVIRAFNSNKPFNQFTIEQIAGDLLPAATDDQITATAFHRNTLTNNEGGTNDEEFRNVAVVDRVNTTMAVWMGTTMSCAQCHDHKFDPLTQKEFFRLFAFFNETADADRTDETPVLSVYDEPQRRERSRLIEEIARLDKLLATSSPEIKAGEARWAGAFPLDVAWTTDKPSSVTTEENAATKVLEDGSVQVAAGADHDLYKLEIPLSNTLLRAVRLEALPLDSLPGRGPGHAQGNFLITNISARLTMPAGYTPRGRYVRIELPGSKTTLSLAEVQVFAGEKNVALGRMARQSSVDEGAPAERAVDGSTDGRYRSGSTAHTAPSENPWWEVDLDAEQPIDRIVVWNRTDEGTIERLKNFRVLLFNDRRRLTWQQSIPAAPTPSVSLATKDPQRIGFERAVADYAQPGLSPSDVLENQAYRVKGWSNGGSVGQPHALTLVTPYTIEAPPGSQLTFGIEQASERIGHCLGHFRLSVTADERAAEQGQTPLDVIDILKAPLAARTPAQQERLAGYYQSIGSELNTTRREHAALTDKLNHVPSITVPIMQELTGVLRRATHIQHRGNYQDLGPVVTEGTPAAFPPLPASAPHNRLGLAQWLVSADNPLTSRVIANRYWEQIFGTGIVLSSEDFGAQGELPVNPELLDWLATELVRLNWDMKAFLKLLVTSAAYRQSSTVTPDLVQRDPDNRLLARGPRFRLSAEMVRDQALLISGLLSHKMYGEPVNPPQPSMGLSAAFGGKIDWQTSSGEDRYRRALYTSWRRSNPYPSMTTFDAPNREVCTIRRTRTNTPLQALVTLNDPVFVEAAQALARRVTAMASDPAGRLRLGFRLCLAREPHADELDRLVRLYDRAKAHFAGHAEDAHRLAATPGKPGATTGDGTELAALTAISNVLLNLDETMMKR